MDKIKKILVALDASDMDRTLIPYAKFLVEKIAPEKVFFVHIIKNFNVPDEIIKDFPDFVEKTLAEREKIIKDKVEKQFVDVAVEREYIIRTDQTTKFIMGFSDNEDIDLILMGRKISLPTSEVTVPRLARRANTNLLIIPEGAKPVANKFLVPIDFSDHSKLALQLAYDFAAASPAGEVICQNVFNVPVGYHYTGKSKKEFEVIMKNNAKKSFEVFIHGIDVKSKKTKTKVVYRCDNDDEPVLDITQEAKKSEVDWVVIGAKGRTAAAALFIGSFAEKLINVLIDVPIFIARPKGSNEGLIDFLKGL